MENPTISEFYDGKLEVKAPSTGPLSFTADFVKQCFGFNIDLSRAGLGHKTCYIDGEFSTGSSANLGLWRAGIGFSSDNNPEGGTGAQLGFELGLGISEANASTKYVYETTNNPDGSETTSHEVFISGNSMLGNITALDCQSQTTKEDDGFPISEESGCRNIVEPLAKTANEGAVSLANGASDGLDTAISVTSDVAVDVLNTATKGAVWLKEAVSETGEAFIEGLSDFSEALTDKATDGAGKAIDLINSAFETDETSKTPPTKAPDSDTEEASDQTPLKTSLDDDVSETATGEPNAEFANSGEYVYDTGQNPFNTKAKEDKTDQNSPEELNEVLAAADDILSDGLEEKIDQAPENGQLDGQDETDATTPSLESTLTGIGSGIISGVAGTFIGAGENLVSLVTTGELPKSTETLGEEEVQNEADSPKLSLAGEAANAGGQVLVDAMAAEQGWSDIEQFTAKVAMATAAKGIGNAFTDGSDFADGNSLTGNITEIGIGMGTEVVWDKMGEQLGLSPEELGQTKAAVTVLANLNNPTEIGIDTGLTGLLAWT